MFFHPLPKSAFLNFDFNQQLNIVFRFANINDQFNRSKAFSGARVFPVANTNQLVAKPVDPSCRPALANTQTL